MPLSVSDGAELTPLFVDGVVTGAGVLGCGVGAAGGGGDAAGAVALPSAAVDESFAVGASGFGAIEGIDFGASDGSFGIAGGGIAGTPAGGVEARPSDGVTFGAPAGPAPRATPTGRGSGFTGAGTRA